MTGGGRPIRFLSLVTVGWIAARVFVLWHDTGSLPQAIRRALPSFTAQAESLPAIALAPRIARTPPVHRQQPIATPIVAEVVLLAAIEPPVATWPIADGPAVTPTPTPVLATVAPAPQPQNNPASPGSRLSVSSWLIARDGTASGSSLSAPQLGGTQAGVRVDYALGHNIALTGRLASPAAGTGREASLGIAWRPAGGALRFVAEQRIALDGGRGGPAIGVSGGVSDLSVIAGFRADGYAQAGTIFRTTPDHYVDAALRAARPVARIGGTTIDIGAGVWGGAQRGVARIDAGPSLGARVPVGRSTIRASLDWRQRIAGNARPGSGPALTLGSDF
ncbi:hypothetical protein [Sphingomonas sp. RS2018]